jgi:hypothetical protein
MLTARTRLFHFIAIAAIVSLGCYGCNKPAETPSTPGPSSSGETETSTDHGLTAEAAQELLPSAASMSSADFEKLASAQTVPRFDSIKSKTLTFVLLTLNPQTASAENEAVLEDFNFPTGNALPQPSEIAEVIYKSKAKGYATFLQPDLITHCTCQSDGDTASGFVTFSAPDLYAGKVQFIARRNEGKWQIEEFHLTNYGIKTVLGNDGKWQQSPLETTDTSEEGSETNETSATEEADEPSNTTEPDEAGSASDPAAVAPVTDGSNHLTNLIARHLVCKAASMSNANFKQFAGPQSNFDADDYQNKSLTLVLLTHNLKNASLEAGNDFQFLGELNLSKFADALSRSELQGYASIIQPGFITHSACTTTGNTATGFVTFHAKELYTGKVNFVARRQAKSWRIEQFELPHYKIKLVLGKDGNWQHAIEEAKGDSKEANP